MSRITTNVFLDEVRRRRRRPQDALPADPDLVLPPAPAADVALAQQTLPEDIQVIQYFDGTQPAYRCNQPSGPQVIAVPSVVGMSEEAAVALSRTPADIFPNIDIPVIAVA